MDHIQANDRILTYGKSHILESFFEAAKQKSKHFEIIICESAPSYSGQSMALKLAKLGINVTLIPDSAVLAVMSRIDKVIFSTHSIMANGGLVTHLGAYMISLAA